MSIPKEPRQQMINIMYLVLIALLALNVSNEILNAFKLLNDSMTTTKQSVDEKVTNTLAAFKAQVAKDKGKGQEFLTAAEQSREITSEFNALLDEMKEGVIDISGGYKKDDSGNDILDEKGQRVILSLDNQDGPSKYMVKGTPSIQAQGPVLKEKIESTIQKYLGLFDIEGLPDSTMTELESIKKQVAASLPLRIEEPPASAKHGDWSTYNFYQMPCMAVVTMLNKFQNDAQATEAVLVDQLYQMTGQKKISFDRMKAALVPNSRKFIVGEKLEADIFLAATSSQSRPAISAGGQGLKVGPDGIATYTANISSPGKKTLSYQIRTKTGYGEDTVIRETFEYEAVNPPDHVAVVSADKMNVFYIGVDNPVSASIAGIRNDLVKVSMTGGTINKGSGAGKYTVRVSSPGKATVRVSGPKATGGTYEGSAEFRAKRIPDPVPMIGKKKGGGMKSGEFRAQQGLIAVLEDFDFDAKFKVLGYEVTMAEPNKDLRILTNQGSRFAGGVRGLVDSAKPNTIYYFDKIKAKGPDGTTRTLPTVAIKIL